MRADALDHIHRHCEERSDEAIHRSAWAEGWIGSGSLSSDARSRDRWLAMTGRTGTVSRSGRVGGLKMDIKRAGTVAS
ncbi:hypothetical protein CEE83_14490, partial [Lactobacillus crispatus]